MFGTKETDALMKKLEAANNSIGQLEKDIERKNSE